MRRVNRVLITVGSVLIALVVFGLVAGAAQDAQFGEKSEQGMTAFGWVALVLGALLILLGVIQHQGDRDRR